MDKVLHNWKDVKSRFQHTDKRGVIIGTFVAIFLATSPYLFYLYEYAPDGLEWDLTFFTYRSLGFNDVRTSMWMLTGKIIPLTFLIIWFFTCRQWWYHALLVPISMYVYQIAAIFNDDNQYFDQFQLLYLVPIMAIIIPSIYLIRAKMFNQLNDADKSFEELEQEFMLKPTTFWDKIRQYF